MASGVAILNTVTRPCEVAKCAETEFEIVLTQGLNRQIRRMCQALGYRVLRLQRQKIMSLSLGDLPSGEMRPLSLEQKQRLFSELEA